MEENARRGPLDKPRGHASCGQSARGGPSASSGARERSAGVALKFWGVDAQKGPAAGARHFLKVFDDVVVTCFQ